jgi:hypothetical protein
MQTLSVISHLSNIRELFQHGAGIVVGEYFSAGETIEGALFCAPLAEADAMAITASGKNDVTPAVFQSKTCAFYYSVSNRFAKLFAGNGTTTF